MTDADLDLSYSALAAALEQAGPDGASLMLAMVCLGLMSRLESAGEVLALVDQVRRQFADSGRSDNNHEVGPAGL